MNKPKREFTYYSDAVEGERRNFNWRARFDYSDGFIGINQTMSDGTIERVLLSPDQAEALLAFVADPVRQQQAA